MTDSKGQTIIPKTVESARKLDSISRIIAAFASTGVTEDMVTDIATAIKDFTEQAIRDDRARTAEDIKALAERDLAVHFVLTEIIPVVTREPFRG